LQRERLSQDEFAQALRVSQSTISRILDQKTKKVRPGTAERIARATGVSLQALQRLEQNRAQTDPAHLEGFLGAYRAYAVSVLQPHRKAISEILWGWSSPGYWQDRASDGSPAVPTPIQWMGEPTRLKRPEAVVDKILRKPADYPAGLSEHSFLHMEDTIASTVVVFFLSQLDILEDEVTGGRYFDVRDEVVRADGTRIYLARLKESCAPVRQRPWFELKVTTLCQWASGRIGHQLGYRPERDTKFPVKAHFELLGHQLGALDQHLELLYQELRRFQAAPVVDVRELLNAENLPGLVSDLGYSCPQREIDGLLKLLVSRSIKTVGDFRAIATSAKVHAIQSSYSEVVQRGPTTFELISQIANLRHVRDDDEILRSIRSQIEFLAQWSDLVLDLKRKSKAEDKRSRTSEGLLQSQTTTPKEGLSRSGHTSIR
jgi:transcriptional regulator with XRE-family HTH domain